MSNTVIVIKKSLVSGNVPTTLANGELAINTADGKLFYRNSGGTISSIENQNTFSTVNANSSLIVSTSITDILSIVGNNFVTITANTTSKTITVGSSNPSSNVFTTTSYTLKTSDAGNFVYSNTSSNNIVYVNANTLPINLPVTIVQLGTGYTSIHGNTGTTVVFASSNTARTQYSALTLLQPSLNFFVIAGDTA